MKKIMIMTMTTMLLTGCNTGRSVVEDEFTVNKGAKAMIDHLDAILIYKVNKSKSNKNRIYNLEYLRETVERYIRVIRRTNKFIDTFPEQD